jgi:hypothetical protein
VVCSGQGVGAHDCPGDIGSDVGEELSCAAGMEVVKDGCDIRFVWIGCGVIGGGGGCC